MQNLRILIVGAGIGGLAAALALQRSGQRVAVYESTTELGDVGAGLTVGSNGTIVLQHLGLGPVIEEFGCVPACGAVLDYRDGQTLVTIPHGEQTTRRFGAPYCQIHRADLHAGLIAAVRANDADCIRLDAPLTRFVQSDHEIFANFADGTSAAGDLLIGCDGIRSTVRASLFGMDAPEFTGYAAWRGVVSMEDLRDARVEPDTAVYTGPGRYITRYKIRGGAFVNYVATARTDSWAEEGWSVPSTVDAVCEAFADFCPDVRHLLAATPPESCYRWGIFDRQPLSGWSVGRATLLGDAAHPITPFLGQGAVMALEDAMILARCLTTDDSLAASLARYEAARIERTAFVYRESQNAGRYLSDRDNQVYSSETHVNEETLGLAAYNAVTVPI